MITMDYHLPGFVPLFSSATRISRHESWVKNYCIYPEYILIGCCSNTKIWYNKKSDNIEEYHTIKQYNIKKDKNII